MTKNYTVNGLNSQEDADTLVAEINEVPGTQGAEIDLVTGRVSVSGEGFADDQILDAVESAGFSLLVE
ncbi:heavy-metal-associated domain-containing protein [Corynebacterium lubricantis]|uniref:heavy-metal-associated domain-containing protein n=1 Tax=Corynebacterium lubricantis TaxID=541095 RepID=UPI0003794315|nr:heavy-metal-associated domain-containing protein [Corynebacterium lubricantis]